MLRLRTLPILLSVVCVAILFLPISAKAKEFKPAEGDNSQWISNSSHVMVVLGQQFTLHFTFENDGTTTWSDDAGYGLACDTHYHASGATDDLGYTNDCLRGGLVGFGGSVVPPGSTFTFTVTLIATSNYSNNQFNTWYDLEHNGQIFGNNNVYVKVDIMPSSTFAPGTVLIVGSQTPLLDDMGNPISNRICPDGKLVPFTVQSNSDVVELASTQTFTAPGLLLGIEGPRDGFILVAAPDPCTQELDFSDNSAIESGIGAIGYIRSFGLTTPQSVAPVASQSLWHDCWPASQCGDSFSTGGFGNSLTITGSITAQTDGTLVDPHWWKVQDNSGNPAAVYGRDWSAQPCSNPDPTQGCSVTSNQTT